MIFKTAQQFSALDFLDFQRANEILNILQKTNFLSLCSLKFLDFSKFSDAKLAECIID